jgi:hypothetical protein
VHAKRARELDPDIDDDHVDEDESRANNDASAART